MSTSLKIAMAFGATLALTGAAMAQEGQTAAATETTMASQVVVRDAATGRLRAPTAQEVATLAAQRETIRIPAQTQMRVHTSSGAKGLRLTDAFMSFQVLVPQADGTMQMVCFESREEAEAALKTMPIAKNQTLPTE